MPEWVRDIKTPVTNGVAEMQRGDGEADGHLKPLRDRGEPGAFVPGMQHESIDMPKGSFILPKGKKSFNTLGSLRQFNFYSFCYFTKENRIP